MEIITNLAYVITYEALSLFYRVIESPVVSLILFGAGMALGRFIWGS